MQERADEARTPMTSVECKLSSFSDTQVVQDDGLKDELRRRQSTIARCVVSAAQLIAEKIDKQGGFQAGYDW
jgi:hypothetical protein